MTERGPEPPVAFRRPDLRERTRHDLERFRRREPGHRFWRSLALVGSVGWPIVLLATGGALFALDLWVFPGHLFELSALSVLVKLVLVALMAVDSAWQLPLFWIVVLWSGVFSHAPATLRHLRYTREGWVRK